MTTKSRMKIHTILEEGAYNGEEDESDDEKKIKKEPNSKEYILFVKMMIAFSAISFICALIYGIYLVR